MSSIKSQNDISILTEQTAIKGTSYKIQLGISEDIWIIRLWKGGAILESKRMESGIEETPNQNEIVQFILNAIPIPNINPMKVMNTLQGLIKEVIEKIKKIESKAKPVHEFDKVKSEFLLKNKFQDCRKRYDFLKHIKELILGGASGTKILSEYEKFPRHFPGILRMFESTLKELGDKKIINHMRESNNKEMFQRINSLDSFFKTLKKEISHLSTEMAQLEKRMK